MANPPVAFVAAWIGGCGDTSRQCVDAGWPPPGCRLGGALPCGVGPLAFGAALTRAGLLHDDMGPLGPGGPRALELAGSEPSRRCGWRGGARTFVEQPRSWLGGARTQACFRRCGSRPSARWGRRPRRVEVAAPLTERELAVLRRSPPGSTRETGRELSVSVTTYLEPGPDHLLQAPAHQPRRGGHPCQPSPPAPPAATCSHQPDTAPTHHRPRSPCAQRLGQPASARSSRTIVAKPSTTITVATM
jgi:hypothetical protein